MQGYPISFNIYAENEAEAADARAAIVEFINHHANEGRAVTGTKIAKAIRSWQKNAIIRRQIIEYLD